MRQCVICGAEFESARPNLLEEQTQITRRTDAAQHLETDMTALSAEYWTTLHQAAFARECGEYQIAMFWIGQARVIRSRTH